ncbi:MAG: hypothetical protein ACYDIE_09310 [Candidatus Krumholzibacteriia bacterium]
MSALLKIGYLVSILGLGLYAWASAFRRAPGAPGLGSSYGIRPWRHRDRFTPAGYRVRLVGFTLWVAGALLLAVALLLSRRP